MMIDCLAGAILVGCNVAVGLLLLVPPVPDLLVESLGLEILLFLELWLAFEELRYSKL
jgi:hypothetical protein